MTISKQYVNYKNNAWGYASMSPVEITLHNTANKASAQNERDYVANQLNGNNNGVATYHFVCDESGVIQLLPLDVNGWHASDGNTGRGNMKSIGIEIARSTGSSSDYHKAEEKAAELVASLIKDGTVSGVDKIYFHNDRNGKWCPHKMLDEQGGNAKAKTYFKNKVNKYLGNTTVDKPTDKPTTNNKGDFMFNGKQYLTTAGSKLSNNNLLGFGENGKRTMAFKVNKGEQYIVQQLTNGQYVLSANNNFKDDKTSKGGEAMVILNKSDFDNLTYWRDIDLGE